MISNTYTLLIIFCTSLTSLNQINKMSFTSIYQSINLSNYNLAMNTQAYNVNFGMIRCFKMLVFDNYKL